ncbi:hypothetical protein JOE48_002867 [Methylobacterium sp. PvR107]|nr:hypothetical protein [Methylobacterium sp. PvR107]
MTNVHVNRSLRLLRDEKLVVVERRRIGLPNPDRLAAFCEFKPDYLHLSRVPLRAGGLKPCRTSTFTCAAR